MYCIYDPVNRPPKKNIFRPTLTFHMSQQEAYALTHGSTSNTHMAQQETHTTTFIPRLDTYHVEPTY